MNRQIRKYLLEVVDRQVVRLPMQHKVLDVQVQAGRLTLWANVDPYDTMLQDLEIVIVGTGQEPPLHAGHLATVQMGGYVWHVFSNGGPLIEVEA